MSLCGACRAEIPQGGSRCPRCGGAATSRGRHDPGGAPPLPAKAALAELDVPELDFHAPMSQRGPLGAPAAQTPSANRSAQEGGARNLDDVFGLVGGSPIAIELDTVDRPPVGSSPAVTTSASGGNGLGPPHRSDSGREPATSAEEIDPFEARALADYGEPPDAWWLLPLYVGRVWMRRIELGRLLQERRRELVEARKRVDVAIEAFAERARAAFEKGGSSTARVLDDIRAAEQRLRARDGALANELDAHRERVAAADARLTQLDAETAAAREEVRAAELHLAELATKK